MTASFAPAGRMSGAGPNRIAKLRREAEQRGLDPDVWFGNVELVVAERVGQETVRYVSNIFKYYVAYELAVERQTQRERARQGLGRSGNVGTGADAPAKLSE